MDTQIEKQLYDIIRETLPQQVGDSLKGELQELANLRAGAVDTEEEIADLNVSLKNKNATIESLTGELDRLNVELSGWKNLESDITLREKLVLISEKEVYKSDFAAQSEREKVALLQDTIKTVFKNTEVKRSIVKEDIRTMEYDPNSGQSSNRKIGENVEETITEV